MKHLRKSILTLLALTLFGGAGAWAQGPTNVTEFTAELIADWENSTGNVTLEDLQALGFVDTDEETAMAWADAPTTCNSRLIYSTSGTQVKYIKFTNGVYDGIIISEMSQYDLWSMIGGSYKYFYTGAPNQAIELTKAGANQWTLGQTPDYDLELQVEYYEAHALKDIPAGWTVLVNGVAQTQPYEGDSLMIVETDSVTLIPDGNPRRVKSVTLEDEGPAVVEPITVTINQSDWPNHGDSFTKDGVTVSAGEIDGMHGDLMEGGSFSTTLGNFTSIVVTSGSCNASGTGWSNTDSSTETWSGTPASTVSFSGEFMGLGMVQTIIVCTIQPNN